MNKITLRNTMPRVFACRDDIVSDTWRQDITLERGHVYLIEAASGTGKSSLCSYLIGYRNDYDGEILFDDRDIRSLKRFEWTRLRQRSLSYVFQELRLFPELTAWENVEIKNRLTSHKPAAEIESWFERLGIADRRDTKLAHMSFGQQQRVAFMRALCQPYDFILADEPVSHLDRVNSAIMAELLLSEARQQGAGIIVTSIGHHMDLPYEKTFRL